MIGQNTPGRNCSTPNPKRRDAMAVVKRKTRLEASQQDASSTLEKAPTRHDELVHRAARWLKGTCGCSTVVTELRAFTASGECPDAVGWRSNYSILVECKASRSDFLADRKKKFRSSPERGIGTYRFYLCPPGIIQTDDLPESWGLLYADEGRISRIAGPKGNSWGHGENSQYIQQRNADAEIAMLVSALRRLNSA
ncbi:hypothetical protein LCGC14_0743720 [marine sediment metagenome]|uniref:Adenylosuccinate synthase n=1 Tax=marine sediment metagenome TaxID=412755 RepID=A0A0F9TD35_9ZZZZ